MGLVEGLGMRVTFDLQAGDAGGAGARERVAQQDLPDAATDPAGLDEERGDLTRARVEVEGVKANHSPLVLGDPHPALADVTRGDRELDPRALKKLAAIPPIRL